MPWSEVSRIDSRAEFSQLALVDGANVSALCRRFGISRKTGYKWLGRVAAGSDVADRSRRPLSNPAHTAAATEASVVALRHRHPTWGGRKIRHRLLDLGGDPVPAASTISGILRRHGLIDPDEALGHTAFQRFEHPRPNDLWQMDDKGHFAHARGRCHPLTVLDDHSRFSICLAACENERTHTVREQLIARSRKFYPSPNIVPTTWSARSRRTATSTSKAAFSTCRKPSSDSGSAYARPKPTASGTSSSPHIPSRRSTCERGSCNPETVTHVPEQVLPISPV